MRLCCLSFAVVFLVLEPALQRVCFESLLPKQPASTSHGRPSPSSGLRTEKTWSLPYPVRVRAPSPAPLSQPSLQKERVQQFWWWWCVCVCVCGGGALPAAAAAAAAADQVRRARTGNKPVWVFIRGICTCWIGDFISTSMLLGQRSLRVVELTRRSTTTDTCNNKHYYGLISGTYPLHLPRPSRKDRAWLPAG